MHINKYIKINKLEITLFSKKKINSLQIQKEK